MPTSIASHGSFASQCSFHSEQSFFDRKEKSRNEGGSQHFRRNSGTRRGSWAEHHFRLSISDMDPSVFLPTDLEGRLGNLGEVKQNVDRIQEWVENAIAVTQKQIFDDSYEGDVWSINDKTIEDIHTLVQRTINRIPLRWKLLSLRPRIHPSAQNNPLSSATAAQASFNTDTAESIIGPEGGEIRIGSSAIVSFPPGSIQKPTKIKLKIVDTDVTTTPEEGFVDITPTIECFPAGLTFPEDKPAIFKLATWVTKPADQQYSTRGVVFNEDHPNQTFEQVQNVEISNEPIIEFKCYHFSRKKVAVRREEEINIRLQYFLTCDEHDNFTISCVVAEQFHVETLLDRYRHCKVIIPPGRTVHILKNDGLNVNLKLVKPDRYEFYPAGPHTIQIAENFLKEKCAFRDYILNHEHEGEPTKMIYRCIVEGEERELAIKWPLSFSKEEKTENRHFVNNVSALAYGKGDFKVDGGSINVASGPIPELRVNEGSVPKHGKSSSFVHAFSKLFLKVEKIPKSMRKKESNRVRPKKMWKLESESGFQKTERQKA